MSAKTVKEPATEILRRAAENVISRAACASDSNRFATAKALRDTSADIAELIEAMKTQRAIADSPEHWHQPGVREGFAMLVGLNQFATRTAITEQAEVNVAAALANVSGGAKIGSPPTENHAGDTKKVMSETGQSVEQRARALFADAWLADTRDATAAGHIRTSPLTHTERIAVAAIVAALSAQAPPEAEAVGFRSMLKDGGTSWDYVYHRAPDPFELRECVIETVWAGSAGPQPREVDAGERITSGKVEWWVLKMPAWPGGIHFPTQEDAVTHMRSYKCSDETFLARWVHQANRHDYTPEETRAMISSGSGVTDNG